MLKFVLALLSMAWVVARIAAGWHVAFVWTHFATTPRRPSVGLGLTG